MIRNNDELVFTKGQLTIIVHTPKYEYDFNQQTRESIQELLEYGYTRNKGIVYVDLAVLLQKIEKKIQQNEVSEYIAQRFFEIKEQLEKVPQMT